MTQADFNSTEISLSLPLAAINVVLTALAERPYSQVADIIQAIREQALPQVPMPAAQPPHQDTIVQ